MIRILQFKLDGEYDYNVSFETGFEKQKIQTNEEPKLEMLSAISNVVIAAVKYFKFENISAVFRQITFNYPENGKEGFVIELIVKTNEVYNIKHVLKCERIELDSLPEDTPDSKLLERIMVHNDLIEKVSVLREEIKNYALGARRQRDLPFSGEEASEGEGTLLNFSVRSAE
jgi:hypothetical protein